MKKILMMVMCLVLCLSSAMAEQDVLAGLADYDWSFSSGAGGWSTDLHLMADGSFNGEYHDSEMGESADAYPNGTLYFCSFHGKLSLTEQVDNNTWKVRVEELEKDPGKEEINDGIRYVPTEIYGLSRGDEMLLYRPGTPVSVLSEEMQLWAHVIDQETPPTELEDWFLMSEKNNSGFVGFQGVTMGNPWEDTTAEQLKETAGLAFGVPEGAENVIYRYMKGEGLAEMQFNLENDEFCARILPVKLEEGQIMNISGMYFEWENEETVSVGNCSGTIGIAQTGSKEWVELCQWYDAEQGRMYSLSAYTTDPDGLDVAAIAEMVYNP